MGTGPVFLPAVAVCCTAGPAHPALVCERDSKLSEGATAMQQGEIISLQCVQAQTTCVSAVECFTVCVPTRQAFFSGQTGILKECLWMSARQWPDGTLRSPQYFRFPSRKFSSLYVQCRKSEWVFLVQSYSRTSFSQSLDTGTDLYAVQRRKRIFLFSVRPQA